MAEKINITFLGTGSAVPTSNRNHPAVLIKYKEQNLLFDCGEGTQRQFRKAKLNPCKLTKIFITHWHGDHTLGIPGLLQTLSMSGYNGILEIHGPKGTKQKIKELTDFFMGYYFKLSKDEGNNFEVKAFEHTTGKIFETDDYIINCFSLSHNMITLGYSFELKEKNRIDKEKLKKLNLPNSPLVAELVKGKTVTISGKKVNGKKLIYTEKPKKISYVTDTRLRPEIQKAVQNSDLLIVESTYSKEESELAEKHGHLTSKQAATIAKKSKSKILALFHFSQKYDRIPKLMKEEAKESFNDRVITPKDLDTLEL